MRSFSPAYSVSETPITIVPVFLKTYMASGSSSVIKTNEYAPSKLSVAAVMASNMDRPLSSSTPMSNATISVSVSLIGSIPCVSLSYIFFSW